MKPLKTYKKIQNWQQAILDRWSFRQKLSYGYALAIGVVVFGTIFGFSAFVYYTQKTEYILDRIEKEEHYIEELNRNISNVRSHPIELIFASEDILVFHYRISQLHNSVSQLKATLREAQTFSYSNPNLFPGRSEALQALMQDCELEIDAYVQWLDTLNKNIVPDRVDSQPYAIDRQKFVQLLTEEESVQLHNRLNDLLERVTYFEKQSQRISQQAEIELKRAAKLRTGVIVSSIVLSAMMAAWLAKRTSQAIANPILNVTKVAQQVTEEANFTLQVPVTTRDEIGSLAKSLNQLIQWVGKYTDELEAARDNLENRVAERTQELENTLRELKQTQMQLVQNEKMSSLGQMVAGVAHEINNPINFIYGNLSHAKDYTQDLLELLELYQKHYPEPDIEIRDKSEEIELDFLNEDLAKLYQSMTVGAERIREIVKSLRLFSRLDESEIKSIDIHDGIESTLTILINRLKAQKERPEIQVLKKYGKLPTVKCYAGQLNQVFMNVLTNAIDALEEKFDRQCETPLNGESTEAKDISLTIRIQTQLIEGDRIEIRIADNGLGIPEAAKHRLFDPFFTTKPIGKGTGLGLSISHQIITQTHGGKIDCISTAGQGTEFIIQIPCHFPKESIDRAIETSENTN
ncbi:sensor histidine kinase [Baaleninema sp.]|uniref:sensor histidine kinase n=1 Tax=Baaleninema sp. TaxID=3101197 RepID=UPI003D093ECF